MKTKPYQNHLKSSADLQTPYAATRAGFVALALEKNVRATPFVELARGLKVAASLAKKPSELLAMAEIRSGLLTAAGVSDKAVAHLEETDKTEAIKGLLANFLEPAGKKFVEELVYRFLLTRGDTLGGEMRNVAGALAQRKLTRAIISCLRLANTPYSWLHSLNKVWGMAPRDDTGIEVHIRGLSWTNKTASRTLIYNLTVPHVKNNIDLCLLNSSYTHLTKETFKDPTTYVAFGELKGGIDPAGADEHWKTARTALDRIHRAFKKYNPETFFVGAAIEAKMASEIWTLLETGIIHNAANLTNDDQVAFLSKWLCSL
jgi:hypothetical protein